jgi:DNA-binding GntR family transcriptional regulator
MLMETHALVFYNYFRYQMVAFSYHGSEPASQHQALLEAALKRDAETAAETLCALAKWACFHFFDWSFSSRPSQENSAQAEPSRAP